MDHFKSNNEEEDDEEENYQKPFKCDTQVCSDTENTNSNYPARRVCMDSLNQLTTPNTSVYNETNVTALEKESGVDEKQEESRNCVPVEAKHESVATKTRTQFSPQSGTRPKTVSKPVEKENSMVPSGSDVKLSSPSFVSLLNVNSGSNARQTATDEKERTENLSQRHQKTEWGFDVLQRSLENWCPNQNVSNVLGHFLNKVREVCINQDNGVPNFGNVPCGDLGGEPNCTSCSHSHTEKTPLPKIDRNSSTTGSCKYTEENVESCDSCDKIESTEKKLELEGPYGLGPELLLDETEIDVVDTMMTYTDDLKQSNNLTPENFIQNSDKPIQTINDLMSEKQDSTFNTEESMELNIDFDNLPNTHEKEIARILIQDVSRLMNQENIIENIQSCISLMSDSSIDKRAKEPVLVASGSISDRCMTARWFEPVPYLEVEMDLMYCFGTFSLEDAVLQPFSPENSCYVSLYRKPTFKNSLIKKFQDFEPEFCRGDLVDPIKFRKQASCFKSVYAKENYSYKLFGKVALMTGNVFCFNGVPPMNESGPYEYIGDVASTSHAKSTIAGIPLHLLIDHVPCFKLNFWPNQAEEWMNRKVCWPTLEDRKYLKRFGCHIVPKSPKNVEGSLWRISFSVIEKELVSMFNHQQRCVFYLFRALYYRYIKGIGQRDKDIQSDSHFSSYHIKTTMFWICEEYEPTSEIWNEENTFSCLTLCLKRLQASFQDQFLPHFFIRNQNLLEEISTRTLEMAAKKLHMMSQHAMQYVPFNIPEVYKMSLNHNISGTIYFVIWMTIFNSGANKPSVNSEIELD